MLCGHICLAGWKKRTEGSRWLCLHAGDGALPSHISPGGGMTEHTHLDRALSPPAHGHKTGPRLPPTSTPLHSTGRYKSDTSNMAVVLSTDRGTLLIDWEGEWFRSQCVGCSLSFKYMQSTRSTTELHPYRGDFCSFCFPSYFVLYVEMGHLFKSIKLEAVN